MGATVSKAELMDAMEENQKDVRRMVMDSYHDIESGKGREDNTDYIAYEKKEPETALKLAMGFRNTIAKLEFMPKQHELDEDEELAALEIRKCYYKSYKIYFYIDERNSIVYVLRVLHMLVNAKPILLNMRF